MSEPAQQAPQTQDKSVAGHEADASHAAPNGPAGAGGGGTQFTANGPIPPVATGSAGDGGGPSASDQAFGSSSSAVRMRVTASGLNVRITPDSGSKTNIIGGLFHGEELDAFGHAGHWVRIRYRDRDAYVHGDFVAPVQAKAHTEAKPVETPKHPAPPKQAAAAATEVVTPAPHAEAAPHEKTQVAKESKATSDAKKSKPSGFHRYGGGTVKAALARLSAANKLKITPNQIAQLDAVAQVETGGQVSGVDTTDDQVVSIGFHQVVLVHGSVEAVMKKAPAAFAKHGLSLDMTKQYHSEGSSPHQIAGVPDMDDLRGHDWGDRFYAASLEDDVIVAIAEFALAEAKDVEVLTQKHGGTANFFDDDTARAWLLEVHNNRPGYTAPAVAKAVAAGANAAKDRDAFLDILSKAIIDAYVEHEPLTFFQRWKEAQKHKANKEDDAILLERAKKTYEPIGRTKASHIVTKISRHLDIPKVDAHAATTAAPVPAPAPTPVVHHDAPAAPLAAAPVAPASAVTAPIVEDPQAKHDRELEVEHQAILKAFDAGQIDFRAAYDRLFAFEQTHNHGELSPRGQELFYMLPVELGQHAVARQAHQPQSGAGPTTHAPAQPAVDHGTDHGANAKASVEPAHAASGSFTTLSGNQVKETTQEEASTLHLIRADPRRLSPEWVLRAQNELKVGDNTGAMNTETLRGMRAFAKHPLDAKQVLDETFLQTIAPGPVWVAGKNDGFVNQAKDPNADTPADHAAQAAGYASFAAYKHDVVPFTFLGQDMTGQGSGTVHKYLLARLNAAEAFLHQRYGKNNDDVLQKIQWSGKGNGGYDDQLGTKESHQHTMGLAIDIDPAQNPWFFSRSIKGLDAKQMQWWYDTWEMLFFVACKVYGGEPITHDGMMKWSEQGSTEELYNKVEQNRESFDKFLALSKKPPAEITETLRAHGIGQAYIDKNLNDIRNSDKYFHNGFGRSKSTKSFTGIHEDLLVALRDVAGLAWGGTEMSSNENGDFMHFDCRETDFGRTIYNKAHTKIK
jgi:hypothetical protein